MFEWEMDIWVGEGCLCGICDRSGMLVSERGV